MEFDESSGHPPPTLHHHPILQQQQVLLESDNNSDIVIDEKKILPEGKDFKIVFISSESKSGSELNSSLECDPSSLETTTTEEHLRSVKGE